MIDADKQYWEWFWTDVYYRLLVGAALIFLFGVGTFLWALWDENAETMKDKEKFTWLRLK